LVPNLSKYELRKQFFVTLVKLWNVLPDKVVSSVSSFKTKRHLDGFWCDWGLYYNYKASM